MRNRLLPICRRAGTMVGRLVDRVATAARSAVTAISWPVQMLRTRVPGIRYLVDSIAIMLAVNVAIVPTTIFALSVGEGVGYALGAAALSLPALAVVLTTSLNAWIPILLTSAIVAGAWAFADFVGGVEHKLLHRHPSDKKPDGHISELTLVERPT